MNDLIKGMNHMDFNAGIGGASLAAEWAGFKTVAFCEIDPFCQAVLSKHWPEVPIFDDIRTITADDVRHAGIGHIDVAHFSPPCQSLSVAGKQQGEADPRYLWPDTVRVIAELEPAWVVIENVRGAVAMVLDEWISDLERAGYSALALVLPASAVGAPHNRERLFVVAHAYRDGWRASRSSETETGSAELSDGTDSRGGIISLADATAACRPDGPQGSGRESAMVSPVTRASGGTGERSIAEGVRERGRTYASGEESIRSSAAMGDPADIGRERSGATWNRRTGFEYSNPVVEHTQSAGLSQREGPCGIGARLARPECAGLARGRTSDEDWQSQSGLGGNPHGFPDFLDGYQRGGLTWPGWPAGMGPYQHDYEPARTDGNPRKRRLRLKALGNAIVPQQLYPLMAAIAQEIGG